jgi:glycosyltransferase involved in cell wall biosynthesis
MPSTVKRSLRIVVISQFFSPEMGAPAARFHDFGSLLAQRGHLVTVVTGFPNSPSGRIPEPYRGRATQRERVDGMEVLRGWLYASPRLTPRTKSLGFASFAASASLQALLRRLAADVVIATSPPPTVGIPGVLAARRLGAPLIFDVRDLWPEAIAVSGRLRSPALIRVLERLASALYREAAAVTVVTEGKRASLVASGVPAEKVFVLPNGVDLSRFDDVEPMSPQELRGLGLDPERFLVVYAGIFNPAQGLDVLLDAAARLRETRPEFASRLQIALVGDGQERRRLVQRATDERLGEWVRFVPEQPRERIPALLKAAGAVTVTLRPRRDSHTVPSKLYEAMASGRPVLVSADGAPAELLREAKAGFATPAADAEALARAVCALVDDPGLADALGGQGRAWAGGFDRRRLVDRFETILHQVAAAGRTR